MTDQFKDKPADTEDVSLGRTASADTTTTEQITVRVAQLGREVVEVSGDKGMTVGQALEKARMSPSKSLEIRVNNSSCGMDRKLNNGEILMLVPKIVGGAEVESAIVIMDATSNIVDVLWFELK